VLTISDHLLVPGHLTPGERESSFGDMVEIALTAAFS
jgi:purine-nucleoside phosphorylase